LLSSLASFEINVFDPVVKPCGDWHPRLRRAENALEACSGANALIVMTPWPEFKTLAVTDIAALLKGNLVIDSFGCLDHDDCQRSRLTHHRLGTTQRRT
jgi:UDPglucose 6-dehydrogenase